MKKSNALQPDNKFSYRIEFRYKKFDQDLSAGNFINSSLTIVVDKPITEPLQRNWSNIIHEINPDYFKIEIINVKDISV